MRTHVTKCVTKCVKFLGLSKRNVLGHLAYEQIILSNGTGDCHSFVRSTIVAQIETT